MTDLSQPPPDVDALLRQLQALTAMRRGSVSQRFMKCNKPGCACADDPAARHGPYFSWTRTVGKKTQSRLLTAEQAEMVARQVQAGHHFRDLIDSLWDACERWADAELEPPRATSDEAPEKKGSRRRSRPRS